MNVLISEFEPNPAGADPSDVSFELFGTAGETFSGALLSIENDGVSGTVDRFAEVTGTFDQNGLLTVQIPDLENPSFTVILTDGTGSVALGDDLDADDDGTIDDISTLGAVLDAIGIPDNDADAGVLYAAQLGGTSFSFTGAEPELIFRAGSSGALFAVNVIGTDTSLFDSGGNAVDVSVFDADPTVATTFGAVNPDLAGAPEFNVRINEIDVDNTGTDDAEFIELFDGGVGNTDLSGLTVVLYNGSDDASYDAIDLDGFTTDAEGFFVIGSALVPNVDLVEFTTNGLQNGADAVALVIGDASDFPNDTPVADLDPATLVDAIVYDTSDGDDAVLLAALGQVEQFDEDANGDKDNESLSRVPDETGAFIAQAPTPGAANAEEPPLFDVPDPLLIEEVIGSITLGSGAEIVKFDPVTARAFVTSGDGLQVVDASDVTQPVFETLIAPEDLGFDASDITSVDVANGIVAAARPDPTGTIDQDPSAAFTGAGQVLFFSAETLQFLGVVQVGPLPDMLTFNADGTRLLVANEGQSSGDENQPDALENPNGSVSIIEVNAVNPTISPVTTLDFTDASISFDALEAIGVRVNRDAPNAAADLEPEFITIDGNTAYIALQENNAVAVIEDITNPQPFTIASILALGTKDHALDGNGLDASNRDDAINIDTYDIRGLFQPDGMASYTVGGQQFFVTANEGDGRDVDESRGSDLVDGDLSNGEIDTSEVSAELQAQLADEALLGRLKFSNVDGDIDGDGLIEELTSFGARSFSIFDAEGNLVFDSGDEFERVTATLEPVAFNSNGLAEDFDSRSDDKGPEPEAVVLGEVGDATYAFIGLERVGGIMVYDVTDPASASFVQYIRNEDENGVLIDIGPEGLQFIAAEDSPTGEALLAVASEESGTLTFHQIAPIEPTLISEIQGDTGFSGVDGFAQIGVDDISPLDGQIVTIEAVVTAAFLGDNGLGGFFVQEEDADQDGNAATSEGVFVFAPAFDALGLAAGDLVQVTGTVGEFFGQTQISAEFIEIVSSGNTLPTATEVTFPTTGVILDDNGAFVAGLESVEGMLVTIPTDLSVTEMFNLDRFGEYRLSSDGRLEQFTQNNAPDVAGFAQHLEDNAARSIVFDDGRTDQNPDVLRIIDGNDGVLTAQDSFRMGDTIANATGVLGFSFDEYRLQDPTGDYTQTNPRPLSPDEIEGNFSVASLNVLNFFTTLDDGANVTDTGLSPRGADDLTRFGGDGLAGTDPNAEFDRQLAKLVNAIVEIDSDIIGLVEVENTADDRALATLVDAVNAVAGAGTYDFIPAAAQNGGPIGGDAITTGFIYKPSEVTPLGDSAVLEFFNGIDFKDPLDAGRPLNRPALAQTFEDNETGQDVTVAVNHLKSKGSLSGLAEDEDQLDGAGNNNATREAAADLLAEWLATDPTGQGATKQLIVGDLNAYAQETPITTLEDAGFVDIAGEVLGEEAFSFVFDGQTGTLDYALANQELFDQLAGVTEWHVNADEADAIDFNLDFGRDETLFDGTTPARNSDHDPIIVSFNFEPEVNLITGTDKRDILIGTDGDDLIDGLAGNDTYKGRGGNDIFVLGDNDRDRALDFTVGEDRLDVSAWGTQSFDELSIVQRGFGVRIYDTVSGDQARAGSFFAKVDADELTADQFIFAEIQDLVLIGGDRRDNLKGRAGDDILDGGANKDRYTGNGGADTFVLGADTPDHVLDFENDVDVLDVSDWGVTSFDELSFKELVFGKYLLVRDGDGNAAILHNRDRDLDIADFGEEDFLLNDPIS